jgi:hypothetical protein
LLAEVLGAFLAQHGASEKAECYIPSAVADMIAHGTATVCVLPTDADWFGVTYREDRPRVVANIARLVKAGAYPAQLG